MISSIQGIGALLYALLPYTLAVSAVVRLSGQRTVRQQHAVWSVMTGLSLFLIGVTLWTERSLTEYIRAHHLMAGTGLLLYLLARFRSRVIRVGDSRQAGSYGSAFILGLLLATVLVSRLMLAFSDGEGLGGGDAQFHNILARLTLEQDCTPRNWLPIAEAPVMYPVGIHAAAAFTSRIGGITVHQSIQIWLCSVAVLSTFTIHRIANRLFHQSGAGLLAATAYGFMAVLGSLDTIRWTGLPNAVGMQLNLQILFGLITTAQAPVPIRRGAAIAGGMTVLAILLVHHYSLIACALLLGPAGLLAAPGPVRRMIWQVTAWAAVFCLVPLLSRYAVHSGTLGQTAVLVFREPPMGLIEAMIAVGLPFCAFLGVALAVTPPERRGSRYFPIFCWFVMLIAAFTTLQYGYRFATLWLTGGADSYTALTPSRMLTNSVYPGSILIGGLARWQRSRSRPALLGLVTFAAAAFTLIATWPGLTPYLPPPAAIETATRIHDHAPPDIVVAGNFHQLGYLSWRRQQHPPLPASESRNAPALVTLRRLSTLDEWRAWRHAHGLSPWFIDPIESPPHPDLRTVFTNSLFRIRTLED